MSRRRDSMAARSFRLEYCSPSSAFANRPLPSSGSEFSSSPERSAMTEPLLTFGTISSSAEFNRWRDAATASTIFSSTPSVIGTCGAAAIAFFSALSPPSVRAPSSAACLVTSWELRFSSSVAGCDPKKSRSCSSEIKQENEPAPQNNHGIL